MTILGPLSYKIYYVNYRLLKGKAVPVIEAGSP
jgi:hypothetical protein